MCHPGYFHGPLQMFGPATLATSLVYQFPCAPGGGGGVLPYIGYIGMCRGIGYVF